MKQRFLVGSRAFFAGIDGFKSPNRNILELVGNPAFLAGKEQNERVTRIYKYTRQPAPKMIADAVASGDAKKLGKFLVPDVARAIGMTIKDLQALQPLVDRLDKKQAYQKVIYDAYVENGGFVMTNEQLQAAYKAYKEAE